MTEFEKVLLDLEASFSAKDWAKLSYLLSNLYHLELYRYRNKEPLLWERLFSILLSLLLSEFNDISNLAYHYLFIALHLENGSTHGCSTQDKEQYLMSFKKRMISCLPALQEKLKKDQSSERFLKLIDELAYAEELHDCPPILEVARWIEDLKEDDFSLIVNNNSLLIVEIVYLLSRIPWKDAKQKLMLYLDHENTLVRAYAARVLGRFYNKAGTKGLEPPLHQMIKTITDKEIKRPGIAGPFFSPYFSDMDLNVFEKAAGLKTEDWLMKIILERKDSEPNTLPCANGIDFFAHEILARNAGYIQKLIVDGKKHLALQAATEINQKIDELEPILMELGNDENLDICRRACWHLSYNYQILHPEGAKRGFVKKVLFNKGSEVFINFSKENFSSPYSAILYPQKKNFLNDVEGWHFVDTIFPAAMRGELIPHPASIQKEAGVYILGEEALYAYRNGALVSFAGDVKNKLWQQVTVIWHGSPDIWDLSAFYIREKK
ncbi:MAG: hypothetical protein IPJ69_00235 [Deltaproteobacteria bacterium]|nr:MAG: hypothetical protein IPJ69_00235 [Deltaproteobacteria bacterium]